MTGVRPALWVLGGALCGALLFGAVDHDLLSAAQASYFYGGDFAAITVSLLVWRRRSDSLTGPLLTAYAFMSVAPDLRIVYPDSALAVTIGLATIELAVPLFGQLVLSYPDGRLASRFDRVLVAIGYAFAAVYGLAFLLFYSPSEPHRRNFVECVRCVDPVTHLGWLHVLRLGDVLDIVLAALAAVFLIVLARKLTVATGRRREVALPLLVTAGAIAAEYLVQYAIFGRQVNSWTHHTWFWIVSTAFLVPPFALGAGLLWGRASRSAVADLVLALQGSPAPPVRDALARALGDRTLELALWLPERGSFVDSAGQPFEVPPAGEGRAVTLVGPSAQPLAALIHDPALLERRALLDAAGAAARLALENERLQAELRAQLAELRASRARIVEAGDQERRRLERDLHDGVQQRLLGLGLALQLARAQLGPEADGAAGLLAEVDDELRASLEELRELARGIHPAVLTEQGLVPALKTLVERARLPVQIDELPAERCAPAAEAAAYFLVSEGLANVAKHAEARAIHLRVRRERRALVVDLDDDGVGGAVPSSGSGLSGLADRIHALDGSLAIASPPGCGTRIHAEIPCE